MNEKILRYKAIETNQSTTGQTRIFFPDQPDLRNAKIHSVVIYLPTDISVSPQTFSPLATETDTAKGFLVMFQGSERKVDHMPLHDLHELVDNQSATVTNYTRHQKYFLNFTPSWDKCYVELASAISGAGLVFAFGVWYSYDTDQQF